VALGLPQAKLEEIERDVRAALVRGDEGGLAILGYGEVSCVLSVDGDQGPLAVKRLPVFEDQARVDAYQEVLERYLAKLEERGIVPVESGLMTTPTEGGLAVYCVQPRLDARALAPNVLREEPREEGEALLDEIIQRTAEGIGDGLGVDAQLSNWVRTVDGLRYLDITTPLLTRDDGTSELDTDLFLAALPWFLRGLVRRFLIDDIISHYLAPRPALLDLAANLHKERLSAWIPWSLERINARIDPALTAGEVGRYYRADARTWALLLFLRRADRVWQRVFRRRPYPFLLPGPVER
jgi:hypothetical protein